MRVIFLVIFISGKLFAQTELNLIETIKIASKNNLQLKINAYNIDIAKSDIITAQLRPNPILNNQSLQQMQPSGFVEKTSWLNGHNTQTWWQLTKPIQLKTQRQNKIDLAQQVAQLSEKDFAEYQRKTLTEVAFKWSEAWAIQRQLKLLSTAIQNVDTLLKINNYRFQKQVISETELLRTNALSKQYSIQVRTLKQDFTQKLNELKFLLGINREIQIVDDENQAVEQILVSDTLFSNILSSRADWQYFQSTRKLAESNIRLQKSLVLPQPELGFIYNPQNTIPYFGIYATIDIPFFNRNQGEIQKSKILKEQAISQINFIEKQIKIELINAKNQYDISQQNVTEHKALVEQSSQILSNVRYAYTRGGTTIIDFLEAQRSWLETQQQNVEILQKFQQSQIQLLSITGLINKIAKL
ncbi:outer membrane efflux protein (plasmid) [Emticicia oligotrophica DSM 17448]|uniref:Outer membrane efflux protein n=1 Tax=Emticicia oligotrophica (strain DSM 17448 / CIP 109782 / MTCC 6937 / GPTSA100-15) TaxID=929562 RepID=A0ABM5N7S6_EMTOG|nr:TolC family protein [Emticicia oligotrophica]AFK05560.1 outer membrane efflux protein [Emticicia oligotrophica DSM 17448]